jgi:hypothetical protein
MPARMNDFDRTPDRKRQTDGKQRRLAWGAATRRDPAAPSAAERAPGLAGIAPPQCSPPPLEAVLGQTFPVAEPPDSQTTRLESPNDSPPIPLLGRIL